MRRPLEGLTIQIPPYEFPIVFTDDLHDDSGNLLDGQITYNPPRITIRSDLLPVNAGITVFHEIVHAIFQIAGQAQSEGSADAIAYGLYNAFKANPALVKAFSKGEI